MKSLHLPQVFKDEENHQVSNENELLSLLLLLVSSDPEEI